MPRRGSDIQRFLDSVHAGFAQFQTQAQGRLAIDKAYSRLGAPGPERDGPGSRRAVCAHLEAALDPAVLRHSALIDIAQAFGAIEPKLEWRARAASNATASSNFPEGHANALIVGPDGLEQREDVWVGVSLLAPRVRYPDHQHPPEEAYLVLSPGQFRQGEGDWFTPGIGGTLYNLPNIVHAMRSHETPLFAIWCLPTGPAR
jgi:quercetin dioxygenase-like cupin family protein